MTLQVEVLTPQKDDVRRTVWHALQDAGAARFPGAWGRIPNFDGASRAAARVRDLDVWQNARVLKCNPDAPQLPLRKLALQEGKTVYMAVPRLRNEKSFIELDPAVLDAAPARAASIKGAARYGRLVKPEEMPDIDLVVAGSVSVARDGSRVGKGGGYSDLEFALLLELGKLRPDVPVITTVHPLQITDEPLPMQSHDISLDYIVTPDETIRCQRAYRRPTGIHWDILTRDRIEEIPPLRAIWHAAAPHA